MIGYLSGQPKAFNSEALLVLTKGVGYKVFLPPFLLAKSQSLKKIKLFIYTHVRDDTLDLYGFETFSQLQLFELIISVSGIGPKIALNLINQGDKAIKKAVSEADLDFFTAIPRLGKKNAQKIIIELKSKIGGLKDLDLIGESPQTQEVIEALSSLGFTQKEARLALKHIDHQLPVETQILKAIKKMGQNK